MLEIAAVQAFPRFLLCRLHVLLFVAALRLPQVIDRKQAAAYPG